MNPNLDSLPIDLKKQLVKDTIEGHCSVREAIRTAENLNSVFEEKISSDAIIQAAIEGMGFKAIRNKSPIFYMNGLFELSYNDTLSVYKYWSYYLIERTKSGVNFFDDTGKLIKSIDGEICSFSLNYILIKEKFDLSLYKSENTHLKLVIQNYRFFVAPPAFGPVREYFLIETYWGYLVLVLVMINGRVRVLKVVDEIFVEILASLRDMYFYNLDTENPKHGNKIFFHGAGKMGIYYDSQLLSYENHISTLENKIDDDMFTITSTACGAEIITTGRKILVAEAHPKGLKILYHLERNAKIFEKFTVDEKKIYDLKTGELIADVSNNTHHSDHPILGITLKSDQTGYNIWENSEIIKFNIKEEIIKFRGFSDLRPSLPFPENSVEIIEDGEGEEILQYFSHYEYELYADDVSDIPFPVFSLYSLFPYYYKLMTGENICVIFHSPVIHSYILGYNEKGHRVFREGNDAPNLLYCNKDNEEIIKYWINDFLEDEIYLKESRDGKIKLIEDFVRNYFQEH